MSHDDPLIRTRDLTRLYAMGGAEVRAVDGIDLDVEAGDFVSLVGVSGSGKSTLLHLIGGLDTPTSGELIVDGSDIGRASSKERTRYRRQVIGFVFQSFHLIPSYSAVGNVRLALTFQGTYGSQAEGDARRALDLVGLSHRHDHRPSELSGGEQQRVAVARALVHRPRILLADEPTGNLDQSTAESLIELLIEIRQELGTTIVMVSHDEVLARRCSSRVIRMRDGRVLDAQGAIR